MFLSALLGISLASEASFLNFVKTFNKKYATTEEYTKRREIFLTNYNNMLRHNQMFEEGKVTWWRKMTEDYDKTHEEWLAKINLGMPPLDESIMHNSVDEAMEAKIRQGSAPDSWSWVDKGAITSIKDQVKTYSLEITIQFCFRNNVEVVQPLQLWQPLIHVSTLLQMICLMTCPNNI